MVDNKQQSPNLRMPLESYENLYINPLLDKLRPVTKYRNSGLSLFYYRFVISERKSV